MEDEKGNYNTLVIYQVGHFFRAIAKARSEDKLDEFIQLLDRLATRPIMGDSACVELWPDFGWASTDMLWSTTPVEDVTIKRNTRANMYGGFNHHSDGKWSLNT